MVNWFYDRVIILSPYHTHTHTHARAWNFVGTVHVSFNYDLQRVEGRGNEEIPEIPQLQIIQAGKRWVCRWWTWWGKFQGHGTRNRWDYYHRIVRGNEWKSPEKRVSIVIYSATRREGAEEFRRQVAFRWAQVEATCIIYWRLLPSSFVH